LTTFYPTTYFAQRIAGGLVPVRCPLPEDQDPATWEPDTDAIRAYQSAAVIFVNGASFEQWVPRAPLPRSRLVDTTAARRDELLHYAHATTHSHGPAGEHSHEGIDGHTWLDPIMAISQAEAIRDGLISAFPEHESAFAANAHELIADLRALDRELAELKPLLEDTLIICSHPAYNYLAHRYGWNIHTFDLDPQGVVDQERAEELARLVRASNANKHVVLWESPPREQIKRSLSESAGAASVLFSPCETPPDEGDYLDVMRANIANLREAVSRGG